MKVNLDISVLLKKHWQLLAIFGALLVSCGWLLWWQLGTLTGGYSANEVSSLEASRSLAYIFHHPLNAPYTLLVHAILTLNHHALFATRLAASIFGLASMSMFFWLVRHWFGTRSALLGTILFAGSPWFLHTARLGEANVLLLMLFALVGCGLWLKQRQTMAALFVSFVLAAAVIYIPGMIWFVAAGVIWQWKTIDKIFNKQLWIVSLGGLLILAALTPLGWAVYKTPHIAKALVGLPLMGWPQPLQVLKNIAEVPLDIFIRGPLNPEHWLGHVPILNLFCIAMFGLGVFVFSRNPRLRRTQVVGIALVLGAMLMSLGGAVDLTIMMPFIYLLVAAGTGFMLDRWWVVFPRNVIAQGAGLGLISLAILASSWHSYRHYFVAWPNTDSTKAIFTVRPSDTMSK